MPSYFRSLEHLLRYCARPPFALERLSLSRGADGRITRIRYLGVLSPKHKLRRAVTALAIGNVGTLREAVTGEQAVGGRLTGVCCDMTAKHRSHDTSRIRWTKLMARVGEEFPLECPNCGSFSRSQ